MGEYTVFDYSQNNLLAIGEFSIPRGIVFEEMLRHGFQFILSPNVNPETRDIEYLTIRPLEAQPIQSITVEQLKQENDRLKALLSIVPKINTSIHNGAIPPGKTELVPKG